MSRKLLHAKKKFKIVMLGVSGKYSVSEICNEYSITQSLYYRWRDKLFNDGEKLFERGGVDKRQEWLEKENRKLKEAIGDLTMELKKTTGEACL